jgi:hypothetical protein
MNMIRALAITSLAAVAHGASCPVDLTALRSDFVASSFTPDMLDGFWYEHAFIDVAQVGASCQTLNATHDAAGAVSMDFKVRYGPIPFTIVELYTPQNASVPGWFIKNAQMPGGKLLNLPTVAVDVHTYGGEDTMTLYSCIAPLHAAQVNELVFASRSPMLDAATLDAMKAAAKTAGVVWDDSKLKPVDHSKCK